MTADQEDQERVLRPEAAAAAGRSPTTAETSSPSEFRGAEARPVRSFGRYHDRREPSDASAHPWDARPLGKDCPGRFLCFSNWPC